MTDSAEANLELIIERIEGECSNFSVSSRWARRQLMLGRKMFATFSEIDMSFQRNELANKRMLSDHQKATPFVDR